MSINIKTTSSTRDAVALGGGAYFYLVKKGGSGKICQPETYGSVYRDFKRTATGPSNVSFSFIDAPDGKNMDFYCRNRLDGYNSVEYWSQRIYMQDSGTNLYGMDDYIKYYGTSYTWLFPTAKINTKAEDLWGVEQVAEGSYPARLAKMNGSTTSASRHMYTMGNNVKTTDVYAVVRCYDYESFFHDPYDEYGIRLICTLWSTLSSFENRIYNMEVMSHGKVHGNMTVRGYAVYHARFRNSTPLPTGIAVSPPVICIPKTSAQALAGSNPVITFDVQTFFCVSTDLNDA